MKSLFSHTNFKRESGFTLIELLVVISIIGILATLISANFIGIRQRARDTQRKSDVRQVQSALELYKSDVGSYPTTASNYSLTGSSSCSSSSPASFTYNSVKYMAKVPCDPLSANSSPYNSSNYYYYSAAGTAYTLATCLENSNDSDVDTTATPPSPSGGTCTSGKYYVLTNP